LIFDACAANGHPCVRLLRFAGFGHPLSSRPGGFWGELWLQLVIHICTPGERVDVSCASLRPPPLYSFVAWIPLVFLCAFVASRALGVHLNSPWARSAACSVCYLTHTAFRCVTNLSRLVTYSLTTSVSGQLSNTLAYSYLDIASNAPPDVLVVTSSSPSPLLLSTVGGDTVTLYGKWGYPGRGSPGAPRRLHALRAQDTVHHVGLLQAQSSAQTAIRPLFGSVRAI
jgi:hypothetical protein